MISLSRGAIVLEINGAVLRFLKIIFIIFMFPKLFFYFSSHLTPNGLETLAKPCLLFEINIKIEKIHIVKNLDENVVMAEILSCKGRSLRRRLVANKFSIAQDFTRTPRHEKGACLDSCPQIKRQLE
jgi:hypothetical protein